MNQIIEDESSNAQPKATIVASSKLRKRVSYTTKMFAVTAVGVLAVSGPAVAFYDDSPILIPFLELIQQALKDALGSTMKDGFKNFAANQIKAQVESHTKELAANMMPGAFCEADIIAPIVTASVARATGYDEAKGSFAITGANTVVNTDETVGQMPIYNPNVVIQQHNREVRAFSKDATCKPIQVVPVDASGTNIQCSQEERRIAAAVLLGASPPAELPAADAGAMGEVYESARTTLIARKQLSALALSDASNEQKQATLTAWRTALAKPTIEELQKLSADGGVARDALVLQQIIAKLQLENYVEDLEIKRLYAVYNAQKSEEDERNVLGPLRRAAAK
jgi:hypothetical protein